MTDPVDAAPATGPARPVVLITGLSGAGKSSILRMLEDLGFETVDNPPLSVLEDVVTEGGAVPLAAGVDIRTRGFEADDLLALLDRLRRLPGLAPQLLFATADEGVLLRRFSETRRRHPLAPGGSRGTSVAEGIAREALLLAPLREVADAVIDTSDLPLPELRRLVERRFRVEQGPDQARHGMAVAVMSFGFPKGLPREADLVLDLRFLCNPHYDPALRPLTGRDAAVAAFIRADPDFEPFWQRMTALLDPLLPRYAQEGKKYLTVALGCTGGQHRSVLLAELLSAHLAAQGWRVDLTHRELLRRGMIDEAPPTGALHQGPPGQQPGRPHPGPDQRPTGRDSGKGSARADDGPETSTSPAGREAPSTCTL